MKQLAAEAAATPAPTPGPEVTPKNRPWTGFFVGQVKCASHFVGEISNSKFRQCVKIMSDYSIVSYDYDPATAVLLATPSQLVTAFRYGPIFVGCPSGHRGDIEYSFFVGPSSYNPTDPFSSPASWSYDVDVNQNCWADGLIP